MKLFVITALWFFAFSTVIAQESLPADSLPDVYQSIEPKEKLYGFYIKNDQIHFKVTSFGCTGTEDFTIQYRDGARAQTHGIEIVRQKTDRCRRMPTQLWLSLPLDNATSQVYILNPFTAQRRKH